MFMYMCILCNIYVHVDMSAYGEIPADPSIIHYKTIWGNWKGNFSV